MNEAPVPIRSLPGIKRDGTVFEGDYYIDGKWCRFQRGLPRKMGGYRSITTTVPTVVRGMHSFSLDTLHYLHLGRGPGITQMVINSLDQLAATNDRTPAALITGGNLLWQFDVLYDQVAAVSRLVAHSAPNLEDMTNSIQRKIWYGDVTGVAALADTTLPTVSGGIVVVGPRLVTFGNSGHVTWTKPNDLTTVDNEAFITQQKIVRGGRVRGGGVPAALLWSLDSVHLMTYVGGGPIWDFDVVDTETSLLSSQGIIEYDGVYYWWAVDRCKMYNGVVQEVPNQLNTNWFLDNLNFHWQQKVFAFKVPRFGEIWWCYPRGSATECTHAIIYNVREQTWYDTELPGSGRTAGVYASVHFRPFMVDNSNTLWQHEIGYDEVLGNVIEPIQSYFETAEMSLVEQQGQKQALRVGRIEPDFVQRGPLRVSVRGRANARATPKESEIFTFPETPANGTQETVPLKETRRLMSFKFESNSVGGHYEMGNVVGHIEPADARITT